MAEERRIAPGARIGENLRDRASSLMDCIERQIDLTRRAVREVRERLGLAGKEPTLPKEARLPGVVSSVIEVPVAYLVLSADNISRFCLEQAEITRRWVKV